MQKRRLGFVRHHRLQRWRERVVRLMHIRSLRNAITVVRSRRWRAEEVVIPVAAVLLIVTAIFISKGSPPLFPPPTQEAQRGTPETATIPAATPNITQTTITASPAPSIAATLGPTSYPVPEMTPVGPQGSVVLGTPTATIAEATPDYPPPTPTDDSMLPPGGPTATYQPPVGSTPPPPPTFVPTPTNTPRRTSAPTQMPSQPPATTFASPPAATPTRTSGTTPGTPPTSTPQATLTPTDLPSPTPTLGPPTATPTPTPIPPTATPTPVPFDVLTGNLRWSTSPVVLNRDTVLAAGSTLVIDPGVEVQLGPGVEFDIAGRLDAQGTASAPVRFTGPNGSWNTLAGQPGSKISLAFTQIRGAGRGTVAISSQGGHLTISDSSISDGSGGILARGADLTVRRSRISGNTLSSPAIYVALSPDTQTTLIGNVIGTNQVGKGVPQVKLQAGTNGSGGIDVQNNLVVAGGGPGIEITTAAPVSGTIRCNSFEGGTTGLMVDGTVASSRGFALAIDTNSFHNMSSTGTSSTVALDASNNWWGDESGPYDATRNPNGKGERIGVNVAFQPWLDARPACAPTR